MNVFYRMSRLLFKTYFCVFHRLEVYGIEKLPEGAAIIAPNHVSYWDPPLIAASCPEMLVFLAKKSLFDVPILSWCIRHLNAYPVTGTNADLSSIKLICKFLSDGKKVVIFPEGERTIDGKLTTIKSGIGMLAHRSGASIVPVYIDGAFDVWPIYRRFPKLWGKIKVTFGAPIFMSEFSNLPKKEAQEAILHRLDSALKEIRHAS